MDDATKQARERRALAQDFFAANPDQWSVGDGNMRYTSDGREAADTTLTGKNMKLFDDIADNGRIIIDGFYSDGYPWETNWAQESGCSISQDGKDILATFEKYGCAGAKLRDAIRHAEMLHRPVPAEAYDRLAQMGTTRRSCLGAGSKTWPALNPPREPMVIKKGDAVRIKPAWQDAGDDAMNWVAIEDEDGGRVRIRPQNTGLRFPPNQVVLVSMLEPEGNKT
jgi:hypothetical protein